MNDNFASAAVRGISGSPSFLPALGLATLAAASFCLFCYLGQPASGTGTLGLAYAHPALYCGSVIAAVVFTGLAVAQLIRYIAAALRADSWRGD